MTRTYTPWFLLAVALALAAVYLFPLYWMYVTSLKTGSEIFANPPTFWPNNPNPGIYPEVWARRAMPTFLSNSVLIAGGVTAITVILGTGCAYVLARYRNVWIDIGLFCVLMLQVLPASVMVTPLFCRLQPDRIAELPTHRRGAGGRCQGHAVFRRSRPRHLHERAART